MLHIDMANKIALAQAYNALARVIQPAPPIDVALLRRLVQSTEFEPSAGERRILKGAQTRWDALHEQLLASTPEAVRRDYAKALAATTTSDAMMHLRRATSEQPQNVSAQRMLCHLLLLRHEFAEAREHAMAIKAYLPHDKTYAILLALDMALNGRGRGRGEAARSEWLAGSDDRR